MNPDDADLSETPTPRASYHVIKRGHVYSGRAYYGPALVKAGYVTAVYAGGTGAETHDYWAALDLARDLLAVNPVGWDIYDARTGYIVWSTAYSDDRPIPPF